MPVILGRLRAVGKHRLSLHEKDGLREGNCLALVGEYAVDAGGDCTLVPGYGLKDSAPLLLFGTEY
jgi:hypothetical protein